MPKKEPFVQRNIVKHLEKSLYAFQLLRDSLNAKTSKPLFVLDKKNPKQPKLVKEQKRIDSELVLFAIKGFEILKREKEIRSSLEAKTKKLQFRDIKINLGSSLEIANYIKSNMILEEIHFINVKIDPVGLNFIFKALESNAAVKKLVFKCTPLFPVGAKYLSSVLLKSKILTTLEISNSQIGYPGLKAITSALQRNESLIDLKLNGVKIGFKRDT